MHVCVHACAYTQPQMPSCYAAQCVCPCVDTQPQPSSRMLYLCTLRCSVEVSR